MADNYHSFTEEQLASEIWKPIPGYEGHYEASNIGRIRSFKRSCVILLPKKLKKGGYLRIALSRNDIRKVYLVHRLVYLSFFGSLGENLVVCHKNSVTNDNRIENLRLDTQKGNVADRTPEHWRQTTARGSKIKTAKLTDEKVIEIRKRAESGENSFSIANDFGVGYHTVRRVVQKKTWTHI